MVGTGIETGTGAADRAASRSFAGASRLACLPALTRSFSSLPTLKKGSRFGWTLTRTPVRGFRPS